MSEQTRRLFLNRPYQGETDWTVKVNDNWDSLDIAPDRIVFVEKDGMIDACEADGTPGKPFGGLTEAYSHAENMTPPLSATKPALVQLGAGEWDLEAVSNKGLNMDTSHIHLRGQGRSVSIITCDDAGSTTVDCASGVATSISGLSIRNEASSGTSYALNQASINATVLDCEITAPGTAAKAVNTASGTFRNCVISGGDPAITSCSGDMARCLIEATGTNADAVTAVAVPSDMVMSSCLCLATGSSGCSITADSSVTPKLRGVICEGDLHSNVAPTSDSSWCVEGKWYVPDSVPDTNIRINGANKLQLLNAKAYVLSRDEDYLDLGADDGIRHSVPTSQPGSLSNGTLSFYLDDSTSGSEKLMVDVKYSDTIYTGEVALS